MVLWALQRPLGADFLKSDHVIASKAETMVETIAHLDDVYGGAREYSRTIGLTDEEVSAIISNIKVQISSWKLLCCQSSLSTT